MIFSENIHVSSKGLVFTDKNGHRLSYSVALTKVSGRVVSLMEDFALYLLHLISDFLPVFTLRKLFFRLSGLRIGQGSTIHMGVRFFSPGGITIGSDSIVGFRSFLDGRGQVSIGNHVAIASEVMIYTSEHDISSPDFHATLAPVHIGDYVFIGPRAIILPGVTIGRGAVIAAGAVITKTVPEYTIIGGVPGKEIGLRKITDLSYRLGRARAFQ